MLDVHRLRLLSELHARGTLAAVAQALSYSPSAVSQQLSTLEREVGCKLLEPVGRRVRLTPQAEILVGHTQAVLRRLEQAETDLANSQQEVTGTIRLATFQSVALAAVPPVLTRLRAALPRLRLEVSQEESEVALPRLASRDVDIVITEEYIGHPMPRLPGLQREDLLVDSYRLALPPDRDGSDVKIADLAEDPWIMEPRGTVSRDWAVAQCRNAGFEPFAPYESADLHTQLRLVRAGHAVTMLPDLFWVEREPTVTLVGFPGGHRARRLSTVVRQGAEGHPAVQTVRRLLREALAEVSPPDADR